MAVGFPGDEKRMRGASRVTENELVYNLVRKQKNRLFTTVVLELNKCMLFICASRLVFTVSSLKNSLRA